MPIAKPSTCPYAPYAVTTPICRHLEKATDEIYAQCDAKNFYNDVDHHASTDVVMTWNFHWSECLEHLLVLPY